MRKLIAFRMRLEGMTYDAIAKRTGDSEFTLRRYFSPKGKWHEEYTNWRDKELTQIKDQLHAGFLSQAMEAMRVVIASMNSDNPSIAFAAARDILDRSGFHKNSDAIIKTTESTDIAEQIIRRYQNKK